MGLLAACACLAPQCCSAWCLAYGPLMHLVCRNSPGLRLSDWPEYLHALQLWAVAEGSPVALAQLLNMLRPGSNM